MNRLWHFSLLPLFLDWNGILHTGAIRPTIYLICYKYASAYWAMPGHACSYWVAGILAICSPWCGGHADSTVSGSSQTIDTTTLAITLSHLSSAICYLSGWTQAPVWIDQMEYFTLCCNHRAFSVPHSLEWERVLLSEHLSKSWVQGYFSPGSE